MKMVYCGGGQNENGESRVSVVRPARHAGGQFGVSVGKATEVSVPTVTVIQCEVRVSVGMPFAVFSNSVCMRQLSLYGVLFKF